MSCAAVYFVPTACFSAQVRHRAGHHKRLAPACEMMRLGGILGGNGRAERAHSLPKSLPYFKRTTLAQELCGCLCVGSLVPRNLPPFLIPSHPLAQELCGFHAQLLFCAYGMFFCPFFNIEPRWRKSCAAACVLDLLCLRLLHAYA
ncbi:hypothetical protein SAMN05421877_109182 [Sphingobacterium lactis]|uniref:Uncharacterized protein n=1 Tax=Sphingobacterium lactis TaxID=797291 RepID=A0A1H6B562_9SPHI|nr:hypothetical protein SAMN05421877_109182 [Sphingobacterium lactis]